MEAMMYKKDSLEFLSLIQQHTYMCRKVVWDAQCMDLDEKNNQVCVDCWCLWVSEKWDCGARWRYALSCYSFSPLKSGIMFMFRMYNKNWIFSSKAALPLPLATRCTDCIYTSLTTFRCDQADTILIMTHLPFAFTCYLPYLEHCVHTKIAFQYQVLGLITNSTVSELRLLIETWAESIFWIMRSTLMFLMRTFTYFKAAVNDIFFCPPSFELNSSLLYQ